MGDDELVYEPVGEPDRQAFLAARARGDSSALSHELLALTFYDPDWRWVQDRCLALLDHDDDQCRYIAVLCLGHLAAFIPVIDFAKVLPAVRALDDDPSPLVRDRVATFFDDLADKLPIVAYLPVGEADRHALAAARDRRDIHDICSAMLALTWRDSDIPWVQARLLEALYDPDSEVRRIAVVCLRTMVRARDDLDYPQVLTAVRAMTDDDDGVRAALSAFADSMFYAADVDDYTFATVPDRHALARAHADGDSTALIGQLAALSMEDPDWRWVQAVCLDLVHAQDAAVRVAAVTCLTNLLFLRHQLDRTSVSTALKELNDEAVAPAIRAFFHALEDDERQADQSNG